MSLDSRDRNLTVNVKQSNEITRVNYVHTQTSILPDNDNSEIIFKCFKIPWFICHPTIVWVLFDFMLLKINSRSLGVPHVHFHYVYLKILAYDESRNS